MHWHCDDHAAHSKTNKMTKTSRLVSHVFNCSVYKSIKRHWNNMVLYQRDITFNSELQYHKLCDYRFHKRVEKTICFTPLRLLRSMEAIWWHDDDISKLINVICLHSIGYQSCKRALINNFCFISKSSRCSTTTIACAIKHCVIKYRETGFSNSNVYFFYLGHWNLTSRERFSNR